MTKEMKRRQVEKALEARGCIIVSDRGEHTKWQCECGEQHTANVPRHTTISPGVIRNTIQRMACLPKGWLQ